MKSDKYINKLKKQVKALRDFLFEAGFNNEKRSKYLNRPNKDFTRKWELEFTTTVTLILSLLKKA